MKSERVSFPGPVVALVLVILVSGCALSPERRDPAPAMQGGLDLRNNAYSLFYDLLQDERHLSKLLIVKRDRRELNQLVKKISQTAADAADRLKALAKSDRSLDLLSTSLPPGEAATRKAIADTKKRELLGRSGWEFERTLLLTQMEALSYGSHLATVAAKHDANPDRSAYLSALSQSFDTLREEVARLLFQTQGRP